MPFLTISELQDEFAIPSHEQVLQLADKPVTSEPFGEWTAFVRLYSDEDCYVAFGEGRVEAGSFPISCCDPAIVKVGGGSKLQVMLAEPPEAPAADEPQPQFDEPAAHDHDEAIDRALRAT